MTPRTPEASLISSRFEIPQMFNGKTITKTERLDRQKLKLIIDNLDKLGDIQVYDHVANKYMDKEGSLTFLRNYYARVNEDGTHKVTYRQTKKSGGHGRYYPEGGYGLGCLPRAIRNTIAGDYYYDIDLKNCHPTLMVYLCERNGIQCDEVKGYLVNREKVLKRIMDVMKRTRDEAKTEVLAWMYGRKGECLHGAIQDNEQLMRLFDDISRANAGLASLYPEYNLCEDGDRNQAGKTASRLLQDLENAVLMVMDDALNEIAEVFCYDGLMVPKSEVNQDDLEDLMVGMIESVKSTIGIPIQLESKPMMEPRLNLEGLVENDGAVMEKLLENLEDGKHDDFAQLYYHLRKGTIMSHHIGKDHYEWFMFDPKEHRWVRSTSSDIIRDMIEAIGIRGLEYECEIKKKAWRAEGADRDKLNARAVNVFKALKTIKTVSAGKGALVILASHAKNERAYKQFDMNLNLIHFTNGVFDLTTKTLRAGRPDDYITLTTGYALPEKDEAAISWIRDKITEMVPSEAEAGFLFRSLAYSLGEKGEQIFPIWIGEGGNGKSVLEEVLMATFGGYGYTMPASYFTTSVGSSSSAQAELFNCKGRRLVMSVEPDANQKMNGAKLKEFSGGDAISCRGLFRDMETVNSTWCPMMMCNGIPKVEFDEGVGRRLRVVLFDKLFRTADKIPKTGGEHFRLADRGLKEKLKGVAGQLMWLLLDVWRPDLDLSEVGSMAEQRGLYRDDCAGDVADFIEECVVANPSAFTEGKVAYGVYCQWVPNGTKPMAKDKWAKALKSMGIEGNKSKKVDGKVKKGYVGYEIKFEGHELLGDEEAEE
jgi:P4 family phage/plasmid primase-like protien